MLADRADDSNANKNSSQYGAESKGGNEGGTLDDHGYWPGEGDGFTSQAKCRRRVMAATEAISRDNGGKNAGGLPLLIERMLREIKAPSIDWRAVLNDFVQEEINDYTFTPPDRRMQDADFFLPDYNEKDYTVKDLLFYVDTSGSISDKEIAAAYSEIAGAIEQFGGRLTGKLAFFDTSVTGPIDFDGIGDIANIRPKGGGGTNFHSVLEHLGWLLAEREEITCAIILTDGYADFPPEQAAHDMPVLWVINNTDVTPPWGRIARIAVE
jgi:predicted metal-dependent peptidase